MSIQEAEQSENVKDSIKKKRRTYREKQGRESGKADSVGSIIT